VGKVVVRDREAIEIKTSIVDKMISAISPKWGVRRFASRLQEANAMRFAANVGYVGGRYDRKSMQEWSPYSGSADDEFLGQQYTVRARTRDLARNAPVATGASNTSVTNVVGTGLRLHSRIDADYLGLSEDEAKEKQKELERIWKVARNELDFEGDISMVDMQAMVFRATFESGDILVIRRRDLRPGNVIPLKVQLVEADRISNPEYQSDTEEIAGGVETSARGVTRAYFVADRHPTDLLQRGQTRWTRIPKVGRGGIHLSRLIYDKRRPGQRRGVPALAPVIEPLKQLSRLTDYELTASVVSSLFTVFVKSEQPATGGLPASFEGAENEEIPSKAGDIFLNPGSIVDLRPGEDIITADPNRPNNAFEPFFQAIVQQIGMALEIPYEMLMHRYNNSYSAARAAFLDAWKFFRHRRAWLGNTFCNLVYEWVLMDALLEGVIDLPGFLTDPMAKMAWLGADWVGDAPGAINEGDAVAAAIARVDAGFSTRSQETAELTGRDWDDVQTQRAREKRRLDDDEMPFMADPAKEKGEAVTDTGEEDGNGNEDAEPTEEEEAAA
jgi:lambda family phage portal protein